MSREDINRKIDYVKAKRDEATGIRAECNEIKQTLKDSLLAIEQSFAPLVNFQSENRHELELLVQSNEMLKYSKEQSQQALEDVTAAAEIQNQKNKVELDAKKSELKEKFKLLSIVKKERVCVATTLKEKQELYDEMQQVLQAEQAKQNQNRETLIKLAQQTESKEKMSRLTFLQAKSARKDEEIRKLAAENEEIRKNNARLSKESASREAKLVAKSEEASRLQLKVDEYKATYKRLEEKNHKIGNKVASKNQKIMDEIDRLKQAIAEKRATQESQLKTNAELTVPVNSVIGDCDTTEQKISELRTELEQLNEECSQLNDKIQVAKDTKILNENKLKALQQNKAKSLKESDNRAPNEDQAFKLPVTRTRRHPPTREQTPVPSKNPRPSRKVKRHHPSQQVPEPVPDPVPEQNIRNSPDSSMTDSWANVSGDPTDVVDSELRRHIHTMALFQKNFTSKN